MDFYLLLGVQREATAADIKRAYKRLARKYHPDINPGDQLAEQQFRRIAEAYETLIDPDRRRRYDVTGVDVPESDRVTFGFEGFDFSVSVSGDSAPTFGDLFGDVPRSHQRLDANLLRDLLAQVPDVTGQGLVRVLLGTPLLSMREAAGDDMKQRQAGAIGQRKQGEAPERSIGVGRQIQGSDDVEQARRRACGDVARPSTLRGGLVQRDESQVLRHVSAPLPAMVA